MVACSVWPGYSYCREVGEESGAFVSEGEINDRVSRAAFLPGVFADRVEGFQTVTIHPFMERRGPRRVSGVREGPSRGVGIEVA